MKTVMSVILGLWFIVGLGSESHARKIKIAIPGFNFLIAFGVAREKGFYANEDLEVDIILMSAGVDVRSLLAGEVDFAATAAPAVNAALTGSPVRVVFSSFNRPMHRLYAQRHIQDVKQLKGKRVGVSRLGSGPDFLLRDLFTNLGFSDRDVAIVALGSGNLQLQALINNIVDAAVVTPPSAFAADEAGFPKLLDFIHQDWVEVQGSIVASDKMLRSEPGLAERFIRATLRGLLYTRENRQGTIPVWARLARIKEDIAAKLYDALLPGLSVDGSLPLYLQKKSLEPIVNRLTLKELPPIDKIYDFTLVKKAHAQIAGQDQRPR
jgi:NitT/TauT family transport system substrate-binding protein